LIPLGIFIVVGCTHLHGVSFVSAVRPDTEGLGRAALLALFSFIGMEAPLTASGEVAQPSRTIPRALGVAMVLVTLVYVAIQIIAQGILGDSLAHSGAPLADAMGRISPSLRVVLLVGAAVSMFGWINSDILGSPRILFAFARDGRLFRVFGLAHPRTRAPYVAILAYASLAMVLGLTGTFAELAIQSTLTTGTLYGLGCVAAWLLARRGVAVAGPPLNFRWLNTATCIGVLGMAALFFLASWQEVVGLATLIGISALLYMIPLRKVLVRL
jgi:amino acid transporter